MTQDDGQGLELLGDAELEASSVVANSAINRERVLRGTNGYVRELGLDPVEVLTSGADTRPPRWLDLCCGRALALVAAADELGATGRHAVRVTGLDLVDDFAHEARDHDRLELVVSSIRDWDPPHRFDLITCVHGLHYVGDKLGALTRIATWLTPDGELIANFDPTSIRLQGGQAAGRRLNKTLRDAGFRLDARRRRIGLVGSRAVDLPYTYLGADPEAGPNYTGQPAVHSYYAET